MSKIEELIEKLCPDGVKYKNIEELCEISRGKVMSKEFIKSNVGEYPVYSSQTENNGELGKISTYDFDGEYLTWTTDGANAGSVFYRKGKFSVTNVCGLLDIKSRIMIPKFLYYTLSIEAPKYVNAGMGNPKLMSNVMAKIRVAVPPLEVQCEIVHILDDFTLLSAELSAELSARQRQYEYYRNKLLNVRGEIRELGSIAEVGTGSKPNNIIENFDSDLYEYINAGTTNSGYVKNTNRRSNAVTTPSRGQGGIGFVGYQENDFWLGPLCYAIYPKDESVLNSKYLYYELMSKKEEILKRKNTGGVPSLNGCDLKTIPINVPNIEVQNKIVNILDKFYEICNDLKEGLPAEIEKRKKQYEYYRDKLLSFKEVQEDV